jgi:peptidoglycan hydrolase-like protein with peptidoglycan-binding domain
MQRRIAAIALLFFAICRSTVSFAIDGPSFDCSHGVRQTLAAILCNAPAAAQADWDLNNAYWALYSDDREETRFGQDVNRRCALPPLETGQEQAGRLMLQGIGGAILGAPLRIPAPGGVTPGQVKCVVDSFRDRAATMRRQLTGDALAESNLSPEDHIAVQEALTQKGLMQNRIRSYGISADGQFGPNTRAAIKDFQRSIGASTTGFLTDEQRFSLLDTPEQRQAREARVAAEEKARQEALQIQKASDERRRQELAKADADRAAAEELRKQAAIKAEVDRAASQEAARKADEQAKQAMADRERKRLEDEAAKAAEWQNKIQQAQQKGTEYAKANDLNWSLAEKINPMTDDKDYEVSSTQTNDTGAIATVHGHCYNSKVVFEAALHDATDPKLPLGLPGSTQGGLIGKKRINDGSVFAYSFPLDGFKNRIVLTQQSFRQDDPESGDTTWRVLAEIETSQGTIYIKVPMLDPKIQKLLAACKRQSVVDQRRESNPG